MLPRSLPAPLFAGAFFTLAVAFGIGLTLEGCGRPAAGRQAETYRYAMGSAPTYLDPVMIQDVATVELLSNIYEGLVASDESNRLVGRLADSWKVSGGGRTWTFSLRKGACFHNGRQVVADDVKWSFERACTPAMNSPIAANYLSDIVGVSNEIAGRTKSISGIQVIDPRTVRFTLDRPRPYFLGKLTYPCAFILPKEAAGTGQINDVKSSVGTGPFRLVRYDPDQEIELAANDAYYLGRPKVRRILRPIVKDSTTRMNLYRTGALDSLGLDRTDIAAVQADPGLRGQLRFGLRPAVYFVGLSQKNYAPFRDRRVRRAVAMAVDRDRICNVLLNGMPEAHGLIAPGVLAFRKDYAGLPYDPAEARRELAAAGYPGGKGLPPLQFVYRTQAPDAQHVSEGVASSLRQNLGMDVQLSTMDWSAFLAARNKGQFESYFLSWYYDYLDPQNFLSFTMTSASSLNYDGYSNPEFDRLCSAGDTTFEEAVRIRDYRAAEDIAVQDVARIPIYFQRDASLVSPRVHGLRENVFGQMPDLDVTVGG